MLESDYNPNWQKNRINFLLSKFSEDFFKGKKILELGPFNGFIGNKFKELGAHIHYIEGREENVNNIKKYYPNCSIERYNLDTPDWLWGKWDIIINFGLYYHLENYHKEHLINCIRNCDLLFFETVVFDSYDSEIYYRFEGGYDQSLGMKGGNATTKFIEDILNENNVDYVKICDKNLNGDGHRYDWVDSNSKILDPSLRRMWFIKNKNYEINIT